MENWLITGFPQKVYWVLRLMLNSNNMPSSCFLNNAAGYECRIAYIISNR